MGAKRMDVSKVVDAVDPSMIKEAPINNLLIWGIVIIVGIFILGFIYMMRFFIKNIGKSTDGQKDLLKQNGEQIKNFSAAIMDNSKAVREFAEQMARLLGKEELKEDKFDIMLQRFQDLKGEITASIGGLHNSIRDVHMNGQNITNHMIELKACVANKYRLGDLLVEKGWVTRDQINECIREQKEKEVII